MSSMIALHLSLISGVGPATVEKLLKKLDGQPLAELYSLSAKDFGSFFGMPEGVVARLVAGLADKKLLDQELALCERNKISWISCFDKEYPALLKNTYLPPTILYWQGKHPGTYGQCLAVVGSRKANSYCSRVARLLLAPLAAQWCIVSGGALGADTLAHHLALECKGQTMAVIGSGLLDPYPPKNKALFAAIAEQGGTVLSSFPLVAPPLQGNFPARNRIIAGLSVGCVVLQAAARSGALITAAYALEQGREVFAVPGPIDDELSAGCHSLIAQGAHLAASSTDILHGLGYRDASACFAPASLDIKNRAYYMTEQEPSNTLDSEENRLLGFCRKPISFDELLEKMNFDASQLYEKLFSLQLLGKLEQNVMGFWQAL